MHVADECLHGRFPAGRRRPGTRATHNHAPRFYPRPAGDGRLWSTPRRPNRSSISASRR
jgi:hypothetical protein